MINKRLKAFRRASLLVSKIKNGIRKVISFNKKENRKMFYSKNPKKIKTGKVYIK